MLWLWACALRSADQPAEAPPPEPPAALTGEDAVQAKRRALLDELKAFVKAQEAAGEYDCCVRTPCNHCGLYTGHCACGEGLRNGDPVCEECAYQWERGLGAEAVDPKTVRSFTEVQRMRAGKICGEP